MPDVFGAFAREQLHKGWLSNSLKSFGVEFNRTAVLNSQVGHRLGFGA
jgi:hypothetical protein